MFYTLINNKSVLPSLWSVNHTSVYEDSELKLFENIEFLGEISSNWPNDLLGTNEYKTLESCWQSLLAILQWAKILRK